MHKSKPWPISQTRMSVSSSSSEHFRLHPQQWNTYCSAVSRSMDGKRNIPNRQRSNGEPPQNNVARTVTGLPRATQQQQMQDIKVGQGIQSPQKNAFITASPSPPLACGTHQPLHCRMSINGDADARNDVRPGSHVAAKRIPIIAVTTAQLRSHNMHVIMGKHLVDPTHCKTACQNTGG